MNTNRKTRFTPTFEALENRELMSASGLGLLPTAVVIGAVALGLSARIAARFGQRAMLLAGLGLITAGLALLTMVPVQRATRCSCSRRC